MDDNTIPSAAETAANVVSQAAETAKNVVAQAAQTASNITERENTITKALSDALREVFGENTKSGRFVDVQRIPLICKSIVDMHENIKEINDKLDNRFVTIEVFNPVRNVVYGMIGLILTVVMAMLLNSVLRK